MNSNELREGAVGGGSRRAFQYAWVPVMKQMKIDDGDQWAVKEVVNKKEQQNGLVWFDLIRCDLTETLCIKVDVIAWKGGGQMESWHLLLHTYTL